jgi:hypothetical protein
MHADRFVIMVLALLMATCACGADDTTVQTPAARAPSSSGSSLTTAGSAGSGEPGRTGPTIPDGTYAKTATRAEAQAARVAELVAGDFGNRDSVTYTYKISGDRFTIFVTRAGGTPEPGEVGTLAYASGRRVIMSGESAACAPCVYTYRWRLAGNALRLTLVGHESTDGPEELAATRFVTEGVFRRGR